MINTKSFHSNPIKIDKKSQKILIFVTLDILLSKTLAIEKLVG